MKTLLLEKIHIDKLLINWRIIGFSPIVLCLTLFCGLGIIVLLDTNMTLETFYVFLGILVSFSSIILTANSFKPEKTEIVEFHLPLPRRYSDHIVNIVLIKWVFIFVLALFVGAIITILRPKTLNPILGWGFIFNVFSVTILFGSIGLWGTVAGKNSMVGQVVGLLCFMILIVSNVPELLFVIYPFNINRITETPFLWFFFRLFFSLAGIGIFIKSLRGVEDTNRLLTGSHHARLTSNKKGVDKSQRGYWKPSWKRENAIQLNVPRFVSLAAYDALIAVFNGTLPIYMLSIVFFFNLVLLKDVTAITHLPPAYITSTGYSLLFSFFLIPGLAFIVSNFVSADRRNNLDDLVLTNLSPKEYLFLKIMGATTVTLFIFLVGSLPVLLHLIYVAFTASTSFLFAFLAIVTLGIVPTVFYIIAMTILIGAMLPERFLLAGRGLFVLLGFVLIGVSFVNIPINFIFPTGIMAVNTLTSWLQEIENITIEYSTPILTIISPHLLWVPVISQLIQVILCWLLASKIIDKYGVEKLKG